MTSTTSLQLWQFESSACVQRERGAVWHVGEGHWHLSPLISINIKKEHLYKIKNNGQRLRMVGLSFVFNTKPCLCFFFFLHLFDSFAAPPTPRGLPKPESKPARGQINNVDSILFQQLQFNRENSREEFKCLVQYSEKRERQEIKLKHTGKKKKKTFYFWTR